VQTLANYAWKLPLVKEAVQELTNILYLDSSIELRGPIDEIREMLAGEGYFFTTQVRCIHRMRKIKCTSQHLYLRCALNRCLCT